MPLTQCLHVAPSTNHSVEIVLGAPSKDCRGYGICKLERPTTKSYKPKPNGAFGTLTWTTERTLELRLDRESMTKDTYQKHFSQPHFRVDEPFRLMGFGENHLKTVAPGCYPSSTTASEVCITVCFREKKQNQ